MAEALSISSVASAIQLSVAPVFLLTGIGAILSVMATRMARIIDRFRVLDSITEEIELAQLQKVTHEKTVLLSRSRWIHWAISLSTVAALFVCIVIAALFIGSEASMDPSRAVSLLFITAMLTLILGLLCFLREIHLSTGIISPTHS